jgi:anti-sigma regulatory factor (Ser/Thr protein kinase)
VEIRFERTPEAILFTVQDQGDGFTWNTYLDFDPERIFDPNGRGIAIARSMSFDTLEYLGNGNTVRVSVTLAES